MALHVAFPVPLDPFATAWVGAGFAPLRVDGYRLAFGGNLHSRTLTYRWERRVLGLESMDWNRNRWHGGWMLRFVMRGWGNAVLPRMWQRARYLWNLGFDSVTSRMLELLANLCCFVG